MYFRSYLIALNISIEEQREQKWRNADMWRGSGGEWPARLLSEEKE
jgi:hypothetical protein